ncbi:hypothetical protein BDN72DRAFT_246986 [Pluteus cervinus]|uniref:Uncharacterized protein n=1 Tax=Pluteus cervinus TaxID=181527 RepID=A0ACD3B5N4_9AGAR|nr:hypothetical protein BDN72DRAFT_246986 [Pluteus cervinus]
MLEGSIFQISTFLNKNQIPHMRQINLEFLFSDVNHNSDVWDEDFQLIPILISGLLDVQEVVLEAQYSQNISTFPSLPLFRDIILPLTALTRLKCLDIFSCSRRPLVPNIPLTNTDYLVIADVFPVLERLVLSRDNVMTFDDLYSIALRCPHLRYLGIGIDVQTFPILSSTHQPPISHGLETLSVGDSPLLDPHHVTQHIHRLFPHLQKISASEFEYEWKTVQSLLEFHRSLTRDSSDRRDAASVLAEELKAGRTRNLLVESTEVEPAPWSPSSGNEVVDEALSVANQPAAGSAPDWPVASMGIGGAPSLPSSADVLSLGHFLVR